MSVPLYQAKAEFFRTLGHPENGEVVYSVIVPEVNDLLQAGRAILRAVAEEQGRLGKELRGTRRA